MQDFKVFIPFLVLTLLALFVLSKRPVGGCSVAR